MNPGDNTRHGGTDRAAAPHRAGPAAAVPDPGTELSVAFVLMPAFTLLAFAGFVDTLRLAADDGDRSRPIRCRWFVLGHDMRPIRASCGVEVMPTAELGDPAGYDYVVVVGGLLDAPRPAAALQAYLQRAAACGVPLVGICTGSFVLAQLGLLQGRRCCVSWFHHAQFVARYPQLRANADTLYVEDRDRLTCAGGTSVVHLASHLVARHCGHAAARKALRIMIEEAPLPPLAPQPHPPARNETGEMRVRKAMLLLERSLDKPLSTSFVARQAGLGIRQLERLFRREIGIGPSAYGLQLRLQRARELLQSGVDTVYDVALQCGFVNHSHFARRFRATFGLAPAAWRRQHQRARRGTKDAHGPGAAA